MLFVDLKQNKGAQRHYYEFNSLCDSENFVLISASQFILVNLYVAFKEHNL